MKPITMIFCASAGLLAACGDSGANYTPILDGPSNARFGADLSACQALAKGQRQFDQETMGATVLGAGAGAVLGHIDGGHTLGGALAGAVAGGVASRVDTDERRKAIVVECMRGRGHAVVG